MREKRQHLRANYHVPVQVRDLRSQNEICAALSQDISQGGLFLTANTLPEIGSEVHLALELPGLGEVELPGFVRWVKSDGGFGVQFGLLGARETHAIGKLIRGSNPLL